MGKSSSIRFAYLMLICGIISLLFGTWQLYRVLKVKHFGIQTNGTIVEYYSKRKSPQALFSNTIVHSPGFSFVDNNSVKHTLRSSVYEIDKPYITGDNVSILYDAANPKNAFIVGKLPWKSGVALMVVATIAISLGIAQLRKGRCPGRSR